MASLVGRLLLLAMHCQYYPVLLVLLKLTSRLSLAPLPHPTVELVNPVAHPHVLCVCVCCELILMGLLLWSLPLVF